MAYLGALTSLGGRAAYFTFIAPFKGKPLRLQRAVSQAMQTGVGALPILSLITFFIGLILALQSAYELRKFGALNYVASAVAISMTRELGPLITAIVVIGRSGSAFAAEIGTMKVTEEIDALQTMAIDPICGMTVDERKARVIELRFFGGLSVEESAAVLKVSVDTVMRDWKLAKAWLLRELRDQTARTRLDGKRATP